MTVSASQAAVIAPLFVWLRILFALGYRYKPDMRHRLEAEIEELAAVKCGTKIEKTIMV
ncbi:hypothetical protein AMAG_07477 [Allomyces macrogynus ATCC 38327]|uniref:Uncharacterized protein n=1 Tax=Allomyces macrogynus (strain ATCC 38327) TaxID=578462 RepID=A0A0L0SIG4_ALLM3|nr:hypothetical protein AMAG_07477 [Allomyces macrogynus ATCC 38327]|eukprot:KNE62239.1 hypothetical protein AMAG_07477 [Allomyces macrogynus ATCC 38327]